MVSGAVGSRPHCVPHSTTLWSLAASMSIAALRMPEVISSFSFGSAANSARGNGVRSRIAQMISKSFSALAAASWRRERLVEHGDVDAVGDFRPVGDRQGQVEIVVENCTAQPRHREVRSWRG